MHKNLSTAEPNFTQGLLRESNTSLCGHDTGSPHTKLEAIARKQETLMHARERLLVERSQLRASGEVVLKQRTATGDAEVHFMNNLRAFIHENDSKLPSILVAAYNKVVDERDKLGELEEEYLQAERTLSGSEWIFIQKERVFYQYDLRQIVEDEDKNTEDLKSGQEPVAPSRARLQTPSPPPPPVLGKASFTVHGAPPRPPPPKHLPQLGSDVQFVLNPPPPPPPAFLAPPSSVSFAPPTPIPRWISKLEITDKEYQATLAELDRLRRQFNSLRSHQSKILEDKSDRCRKHPDATLDSFGNSEFYDKYSELLSSIAECEVKLQHLKQQRMQYQTLDNLPGRRRSDTFLIARRAVSPFDSITRAHTDGVMHTVLDNPNMKFRIRDWLLDYMKNNAIERALYFNILEAVGITVSDSQSLGERAEQYWPLGSEDLSQDGADEPQALEDLDGEERTAGTAYHADQQAKLSNCSHARSKPSFELKVVEPTTLDETRLFSERVLPGPFEVLSENPSDISDEIAVDQKDLNVRSDLLGLVYPSQHIAATSRSYRDVDKVHDETLVNQNLNTNNRTNLPYDGGVNEESQGYFLKRNPTTKQEDLLLRYYTKTDLQDVDSIAPGSRRSTDRSLPALNLRPIARTIQRPLSEGTIQHVAGLNASSRCAPGRYHQRSKSASFFLNDYASTSGPIFQREKIFANT